MKHSKAISKLAAIGATACLALSIMTCPIATLPVQAAAPGGSEVQPQSDIIEWVFKIENGKLYRRLYNFSTGNWAKGSQWEYVCEA